MTDANRAPQLIDEILSPHGMGLTHSPSVSDLSPSGGMTNASQAVIMHFLPPLTSANFNLLSKVAQERKHEEDTINIRRVESIQVGSLIHYIALAKMFIKAN